MSVGKSGVGKSTLGNCMITGCPTGSAFETSASANSCTQTISWRQSEDCFYCDVPGLPDTNADNTKMYYDLIIEEARKDLTALLFVFKYERIDHAVYSKAKLLFRELKKSNAIKVLVINDMTSYAFNRPSEEDYRILEDEIKRGTGMSFAYVIKVTGQSMVEKMALLINALSDIDACPSPHLKTYAELKSYVDDLTRKKNYQEQAYIEIQEEIQRIKDKISSLSVSASSSVVSALTSGLKVLLSHEGSIGSALSSAAEAAASSTALILAKIDLKAAEQNLNSEKLDEAIKVLEEACISFNELENALTE